MIKPFTTKLEFFAVTQFSEILFFPGYSANRVVSDNYKYKRHYELIVYMLITKISMRLQCAAEPNKR